MKKAEESPKRVASIDTLRGLTIFGMILCANIGWNSDLPAWMFHAQTPPPDYVFSPEVRGITWVDLVFPFFLFSMGAAFPFAMRKRLSRGNSVAKICAGLLKRWLILMCFSIVLGNAYLSGSGGAGPVASNLFMILVWGGFMLSLTRFSFSRTLYGHLLNIAGILVIAACALIMQYGLKVTPDKDNQDVIITILASTSLFGGLIWLISRDSLILRLAFLAVILAVKAAFSYIPGLAGIFPEPGCTAWLFRPEHLQYLLIAIPGSIAGDMILARKDEPADRSLGKTDLAASTTAIAAVIFQLWALFTRHVAADLAVTAVCAASFIAMTFRKKELWASISAAGFILMVSGIIFDPVDGGIRKDYCNISYLLTTSGMAAITTGYFIFWEMKKGIGITILRKCGQNPMIAYTVTGFITIPLLNLTGLMPLISGAAEGSQILGVLQGLFICAIMMAVTAFFTDRKIFWRS